MKKDALDQEVSSVVGRIAPLIIDPRTAIWVGSGISTMAFGHDGQQRYPSWPELIDKLCEKCRVTLRGTSSGRENCDTADRCKEKDCEAYYNTLGNIFGGKPASIPRSASHILDFEKPALITTNYDLVLECAAEDRHTPLNVQAYDELKTGLHVETPCLVHLHGRGPNTENEPARRLVLATSEFREAYGCDYEQMKFGNAYRFLISELPDSNVLFLGYSLDEPLVGRTLEHINKLRKQNKGTTDWVMLVGRTPVPDKGDPRADELLLKRRDEAEQIRRATNHDVRVIEYTKVDGNHSQLAKILERLSEIAASARGEQPALTAANTVEVEPHG